MGAAIGGVASLLGLIFGGGADTSALEAQIAQTEQLREQYAYNLEMADKQIRAQRLATLQQQQLTKALMIGGGVLALGAVGTAVVIKG